MWLVSVVGGCLTSRLGVMLVLGDFGCLGGLLCFAGISFSCGWYNIDCGWVADVVIVFMVVSVLWCVAGLCNYNMVCGFGFGCWTYGLLVSLGLFAGCGDYGIVSSWL